MATTNDTPDRWSLFCQDCGRIIEQGVGTPPTDYRDNHIHVTESEGRHRLQLRTSRRTTEATEPGLIPGQSER